MVYFIIYNKIKNVFNNITLKFSNINYEVTKDYCSQKALKQEKVKLKNRFDISYSLSFIYYHAYVAHSK